MSFTPPDLSQVLTNEQLMNTRLTTLRTNLRTGLTNAGISYSQSDTINQLIDRYEILPIFKTEDTENPLTAGKLGTIYQLANVTSGNWNVSSASNNGYFVGYEKDTSAHEFEEQGDYYAAVFGKFNTTPGTYYYGDNNGWKIEFNLLDVGTQYGCSGIGFFVSNDPLTNRDSNGYTGVFIGLYEGYPGVWRLDDRWGLSNSSMYLDEVGRNFNGTAILKKADDYELSWSFKDSNGNVIDSGTFDPGDVWNSDIITFGMYASYSIQQSGYCTGMINRTTIYYEPE
ncbi:hypothetical protein [Methanobrevibacter sp.]|uniref:hypothetical protein n=1 Tax=Methanobrevibacter sp. TaxID=66852 RepID=UPI00388EDF1B